MNKYFILTKLTIPSISILYWQQYGNYFANQRKVENIFIISINLGKDSSKSPPTKFLQSKHRVRDKDV